MVDPVFTPGQRVRCVIDHSYQFTQGKEYIVLDYDPRRPADGAHGFTWPAYVEVSDDNGRKVVCHAYRFQAITD